MTKPYLTPYLLLSSLALLTGTLSIFPRLARDYGLDYWNLPPLMTELESECQRDQELTRRWEAGRNRWLRRDESIKNVVEGRVSLAETVAVFSELYHSAQGRTAREALFPGSSEEERLARHVIYLAQEFLKDRKEDPRAVTARLEGELRAILAGPPRL